jgi:hypothetical protein
MILTRWKCKRCLQIVDESGKERHEKGRHQRHKTQNERYPKSEPQELNGGLGGLDYGTVEWEIIKDE